LQLTPKQETFKQNYIAARGYWVPFNDGLLRHSPEWLSAYLAYAENPAKEGPLSARMRELIYVAVDASTTHMFLEGLEIHIGLAFKAGCSVSELIEVMQIATLQGLDSIVTGLDILAEESAALGKPLPEGLVAHPALAAYEQEFGPAPTWLCQLSTLRPGFVSVLVDLLLVGRRDGKLDDRERALIRLALAASPTHLNRGAMRIEVREALAHGATPEEIVEVFQLVAHLGVHACVAGVPAILAAAGE
jgi:alkylhydroperoxidase/carboxymuconolactone decarboxylase family protein YurZ